jgi:hypothetical protein
MSNDKRALVKRLFDEAFAAENHAARTDHIETLLRTTPYFTGVTPVTVSAETATDLRTTVPGRRNRGSFVPARPSVETGNSGS